MAIKSYANKIKLGNQPSNHKIFTQMLHEPLQSKINKILANQSPEVKYKTLSSYSSEQYQNLLKAAWGVN